MPISVGKQHHDPLSKLAQVVKVYDSPRMDHDHQEAPPSFADLSSHSGMRSPERFHAEGRSRFPPPPPRQADAHAHDPLHTGGSSGGNFKRRASTLSDISNSLRYSTDDLLLPRVEHGGGIATQSSHWESTPLAFALLPALAGLIFKNGSSVVTDILLLGLAAVFLNWSVRVPWDWYHAAQKVRSIDSDLEATIDESDEEPLAQSTTENVDESQAEDARDINEPTMNRHRSTHAKVASSASTELLIYELLALLACFTFPPAAAYLLHLLRGQLSRPSEGLVSTYNLTIFILAAEIRPLSHLTKLIKARTLHLQRLSAGPEDRHPAASQTALLARLARLEDQLLNGSSETTPPTKSHPNPDALSSSPAQLTTDVRRALQPEIDALNRAVRRYEKRATLQAFQTESRLGDLEARLGDAIALAAAAARGGGGIGLGLGGGSGGGGMALTLMTSVVDALLGLLVLPVTLPVRTMRGLCARLFGAAFGAKPRASTGSGGGAAKAGSASVSGGGGGGGGRDASTRPSTRASRGPLGRMVGSHAVSPGKVASR